MSHKDFYSGLFLLSVGIFLVFLSLRLSVWSKFGPGEGFFPLAIAVIMIGLSLFLVVKSIWIRTQRKQNATERWKPKLKPLLRVGTYAILMLLYGFLMERVGFLITSVFFVIPILKYIENQSWKMTVLVGLGSVIISYVLFVYFLGVPLPRGWVKSY